VIAAVRCRSGPRAAAPGYAAKMPRRLLALSLLLACSSSPPADTATASDSAPGSSDASSGAPTTSAADPNTSAAPDQPTDGGPHACDPWQQDCPDGEKCTHFNSHGQSSDVDATRCVPLPPAPIPTGGICSATGGFGAGDDNCGRGDFCYFLGDDDVGVCVPLCAGSPDAPECPEGSSCAHGLGASLYLCLPHCDPFAQDCLEGANCSPQADGFVCALDTSGDAGHIYDPCSAGNGCDPGLMCAAPTSADACATDNDGCCLPLCAVDGAPCPDALTCLALYDPEAHPELADAGVCGETP